MEKHGGGSTAEKRGTVVGFGHKSLAEIVEVGGHFLDFCGEFAFGGKTFGARGLKSFNAKEVHAVVGAGLRFHDKSRRGTRRNKSRAFIRNHARIGIRNLQHNGGEVNVGILAERCGEALDFAFPGRAIKRSGRSFADARLRLLLGKIGRFIFFFGADGGVGANVH